MQFFSRRRFLAGLTAGTAATGVLRATLRPRSYRNEAAILRGTEFDLRDWRDDGENVTGAPHRDDVNGSLPAPTLRWREGDTVTLRVANTLATTRRSTGTASSCRPTWTACRGSASTASRPAKPTPTGSTVRQSGTYWYHSHSGFQEQLGLYGPLVIEPREPEPFAYDREHVVMLSDWTDEDPQRVFAKLKSRPTTTTCSNAPPGISSVTLAGTGFRRRSTIEAGADAHEPHRSRGRVGPHLHVPHQRHPAGRQLDRAFRPGERVRLRFINGSAMTILRRADSGNADDRRRSRRPLRASGRRSTSPYRGGGNLRRHRRAGRRGRVHSLRQSIDRTGYARAHLPRERDSRLPCRSSIGQPC